MLLIGVPTVRPASLSYGTLMQWGRRNEGQAQCMGPGELLRYDLRTSYIENFSVVLAPRENIEYMGT